MPKLIRVFDPDEPERRITMVVAEAACPGLLEFLSEMPYRTETPLIRGILYQWFAKHRDAGTLNEAIQEALGGPGGLIESAPSDKQVRRGAKGRSAKVPKPRTISARPAARPAAPTQEVAAPSVQPRPSQGAEPLVSPPVPVPEAQPEDVQEAAATTATPVAPLAPPADTNPGEIAATASSPGEAAPDPAALAALEKLGDMFG